MVVHPGRSVGGGRHVVALPLDRQRLLNGVVHGGGDPFGVLGPHGGGLGERRDLRAVADLVGEHPADPGQDPLVAQHRVDAGRVGREHGRELRGVDGVGLGAEPVQRRLSLHRAAQDPHPGLAFGAGLGQQPRAPVGEGPAEQPSARLLGLLRVRTEATALHEVDHVGGVPEVQQQVLATRADLLERVADRRVGRRIEGLQRREAQQGDAVEDVVGEGGGHPLGVGADFGKLGHPTIVTRRAAADVTPGTRLSAL